MNGLVAQLSSVTKNYGDTKAVEGVELVLRAGECVALAGHNGAGKSTLIKLMLGLIRPDGGRIRVLGHDPSGNSAAEMRLEVGYLPENIAFHPSMTGKETLAFYAKLKRQPVASNTELLERVGIMHAAKRRVGTYSKGMRQRLGLAQALLGVPKLLLLDEPTTGLDPALRQSFYDIVRELRDRGVCILISSHALAELEGQVDRIVIMNRGKKVADGAMSDLRKTAGLPVHIRVILADGLAAGGCHAGEFAGWTQVGTSEYRLECRECDKVPTLRSLGSIRSRIDDIDIFQPSLDDMYAHFLKREEA